MRTISKKKVAAKWAARRAATTRLLMEAALRLLPAMGGPDQSSSSRTGLHAGHGAAGTSPAPAAAIS